MIKFLKNFLNIITIVTAMSLFVIGMFWIINEHPNVFAVGFIILTLSGLAIEIAARQD
jgi:hypothetical protein